MNHEELLCAGYYLGHPAELQQELHAAALAAPLADLQHAQRYRPPGAFADLGSASAIAQQCRRPLAVHALWFTQKTAARLRRECPDAPLLAMLGTVSSQPPPALAAGYDVLGIGGDLCLSWTREDAGLDVCRELGLSPSPPPFLPDQRTANALVRALEADELGAPVLWVRCWRTVHAALEPA